MEYVGLAVLAAALCAGAYLIIRSIGRSGRNSDATEGGGLDGMSQGVENLDHP